jgi:hypothetical protein
MISTSIQSLFISATKSPSWLKDLLLLPRVAEIKVLRAPVFLANVPELAFLKLLILSSPMTRWLVELDLDCSIADIRGSGAVKLNTPAVIVNASVKPLFNLASNLSIMVL